jgi:O-antigen/teichoic acid export membrane protein
MSLRRIAKTSGALMSAQGMNLINQLLLPPIFLRHYSIASYGEWITFTATVSYLSTLNFGLPTYANNQVAIFYNRGELEEAKTIQATAFFLLLAMIATVAVITTAIFFVPFTHWLGLKTDRVVASWTVYLLGHQILTRMIFGYFWGTFLALGAAQRGVNWNTAQTFVSVLGTAALALNHVSFIWLAAQQLLTPAFFCGLVMIDIYSKAPAIFPRLRYARPKRAPEILKQSGYFGMLFAANFLVYQVPVILIQRILGPAAVVVFSLTRTIFSMSRQVLASVSQSMGPEVTEMYGKRDWSRLVRLYELSERVVFALVPAVSIGTLVATPLFMAVWLHKRSFYHPYICIAMALISGIMGIKEHKYTFQTSSNEHTVLARVTFWSYVVMVVLAIPAIYSFGVIGFLALWLVTELIQVLTILRVNERLFAKASQLDHSPVYKLFGFMALATTVGAWFAVHAQQMSLWQLGLIATLFTVTVLAISFPLFGLNEVRRYLRNRSAVTQGKRA